MKRFILPIIIFILQLPCFAQYERPGSSTAQFLKIGISPRAAALGDAYVSSVNGAEGTFYNSGAIASLSGTEIVFNHNIWFSGIKHSFGAAAFNLGEIGNIAFSITGLYTDEMNVTTPLQPDGTGETFYVGNYRMGISYARKITEQVSFGGTINYIYMSLFDDFNASALALDIGVLYKTDFRDFAFGMQISNFGSDITFVNEGYPLPTNFSFGANINALEFELSKVMVCLAATKPNDGAPLAGMGVEYSFNNNYFLRTGYKINHDIENFSFGGGVSGNIYGLNMRVDYSYSAFSNLGGAHRFGLGFML